HRVGVSQEPLVETAAWRDQRALEARDRIEHRRSVRLPSISVTESTDHFRVCAQLADRFIGARCHDCGITETLFYSFFQRTNISFPVRAKIQAYVEDGRRIQPNRLPLERIVNIGTGAIGRYIVARQT